MQTKERWIAAVLAILVVGFALWRGGVAFLVVAVVLGVMWRLQESLSLRDYLAKHRDEPPDSHTTSAKEVPSSKPGSGEE
jgi:hypothetical protein